MRKLLNTLYAMNPDSYLALDGENVVIRVKECEAGRVPLHNLEAIVTMGYVGASPALMGKCAAQNISLSFLRPSGQFLAKVTGPAYGNILLRKAQYRMAETHCLPIAQSFIIGKLYNTNAVVKRALRDHPLRVDVVQLESACQQLGQSMLLAAQANDCEQLRGFEGEAAKAYFGVFNQLILQQTADFSFHGRSRRPPQDNVNALLSFCYSLLTSMCVSALETVGLDPYSGFLHTDRPGRASLALDLMEELRPIMADRFVLTLINKRLISGAGFTQKENGAILMDDVTRRSVLKHWQVRKKDAVTHPFLKEQIDWGLIPYVQAQLLARYIRGDLDAYPPFAWK